MKKTLYSKKPEMILFDVGGTLFDDGRCIVRDGLRELLKYADNPEAADEDTLCGLWDEYMSSLRGGICSEGGEHLDIYLGSILKFVTMNAGLKFSIDIFSQEEIFDRFNSTRRVKDGLEGLLSCLKEKGIRTAVISNNAMSGEGLAQAIKRWLPTSSFEFCLTSADLLFPKPDKMLFVTAARYAGVSVNNCWYCGDGKIPDVDGAQRASMLPMLIDEKSDCPLLFRENDGRGEYMVIKNWSELEKFISEM